MGFAPSGAALAMLTAKGVVPATFTVTVLVRTALFGPRTVSEVKKLNTMLPALLDHIGSGEIAWTVGQQHQWSAATSERLQNFLAAHRDDILHIVDVLRSRTETMFSNIGWMLIIPVLSVFFLLGKPTLSASVVSLRRCVLPSLNHES